MREIERSARTERDERVRERRARELTHTERERSARTEGGRKIDERSARTERDRGEREN